MCSKASSASGSTTAKRFDAGDAFYLPPGHIPIGNAPESEYMQFSPAQELRQVSETIMKNMQAMQSG
jgi:hypothetical protein